MIEGVAFDLGLPELVDLGMRTAEEGASSVGAGAARAIAVWKEYDDEKREAAYRIWAGLAMNSMGLNVACLPEYTEIPNPLPPAGKLSRISADMMSVRNALDPTVRISAETLLHLAWCMQHRKADSTHGVIEHLWRHITVFEERMSANNEFTRDSQDPHEVRVRALMREMVQRLLKDMRFVAHEQWSEYPANPAREMISWWTNEERTYDARENGLALAGDYKGAVLFPRTNRDHWIACQISKLTRWGNMACDSDEPITTAAWNMDPFGWCKRGSGGVVCRKGTTVELKEQLEYIDDSLLELIDKQWAAAAREFSFEYQSTTFDLTGASEEFLLEAARLCSQTWAHFSASVQDIILRPNPPDVQTMLRKGFARANKEYVGDLRKKYVGARVSDFNWFDAWLAGGSNSVWLPIGMLAKDHSAIFAIDVVGPDAVPVLNALIGNILYQLPASVLVPSNYGFISKSTWDTAPQQSTDGLRLSACWLLAAIGSEWSGLGVFPVCLGSTVPDERELGVWICEQMVNVPEGCYLLPAKGTHVAFAELFHDRVAGRCVLGSRQLMRMLDIKMDLYASYQELLHGDLSQLAKSVMLGYGAGMRKRGFHLLRVCCDHVSGWGHEDALAWVQHSLSMRPQRDYPIEADMSGCNELMWLMTQPQLMNHTGDQPTDLLSNVLAAPLMLCQQDEKLWNESRIEEDGISQTDAGGANSDTPVNCVDLIGDLPAESMRSRFYEKLGVPQAPTKPWDSPLVLWEGQSPTGEPAGELIGVVMRDMYTHPRMELARPVGCGCQRHIYTRRDSAKRMADRLKCRFSAPHMPDAIVAPKGIKLMIAANWALSSENEIWVKKVRLNTRQCLVVLPLDATADGMKRLSQTATFKHVVHIAGENKVNLKRRASNIDWIIATAEAADHEESLEMNGKMDD